MHIRRSRAERKMLRTSICEHSFLVRLTARGSISGEKTPPRKSHRSTPVVEQSSPSLRRVPFEARKLQEADNAASPHKHRPPITPGPARLVSFEICGVFEYHLRVDRPRGNEGASVGATLLKTDSTIGVAPVFFRRARCVSM